jgi:hypothetical protein
MTDSLLLVRLKLRRRTCHQTDGRAVGRRIYKKLLAFVSIGSAIAATAMAKQDTGKSLISPIQ